MSDFRITSSGSVGLGSFNSANTPLVVGGSNHPRTIEIKPAANGYIIDIGCQTFVFGSLAGMIFRIEQYYSNPSEIEQYFNEHKELPNK